MISVPSQQAKYTWWLRQTRSRLPTDLVEQPLPGIPATAPKAGFILPRAVRTKAATPGTATRLSATWKLSELEGRNISGYQLPHSGGWIVIKGFENIERLAGR